MPSVESSKVILTLLILVYASRLDWKFREIDDKSWVSLLAIGGFFLIIDPSQLRAFAVSITIAAILVAVTYVPGMVGGGDAKILLGIAAVFPLSPIYHTPFFVLGVFFNAVLLAVPLPFYYFSRNLMREKGIRRGEFIKMFVGYKVRADEVKEYEAVMRDGLILNVKKARLGRRENTGKEVWVTPAIPFLIPLTLGFLIAALVGDVFNLVLLRGI
jgi:preflagellin peptidase FlaK